MGSRKPFLKPLAAPKEMIEIARMQGAVSPIEHLLAQDVTPAPCVHARPLQYVDRLDQRAPSQIDLLVVHSTELPTLQMAREYGEMIQYESSLSGNSGHFYIDRDGRIEQYVPIDRVAHHVRGYNARSIGVELVNSGRYPHWYRRESQTQTEPYPTEQIDALIALCNHLSQQLRSLVWTAGHDELDISEIPADDDSATLIRRKLDPGMHFPWARLLAATPLKRLLLG
jgi:N-acetylmuramoyl-L-alanine amidase